MLYTVKELLKMAKESQFAIPAFNICSHDMTKAIIEEAEGLEAPVISEVHPGKIAYSSDEFVAAVRAYAYTSKLPIIIHLDHGGTVEDVLWAARDGYSSVMIDTSLELFDDNVQIMEKVVASVHVINVSVRAKLGAIGNNGSTEGGTETITHTDPDQTKISVKETGIDTLVVATGTAHGLYPKSRTPKLNIGLLKELNQQVDLPFVLHGGSDNPDAEVSGAAKHGVVKVNLSSDFKNVFLSALRGTLSEDPSIYEPNAIYPTVNKKVQEVIKHKVEILNTVGKVSLY